MVVCVVTLYRLSSTPPGHSSPSTSGKHHLHINTLRPRQNGRHFPDDIFKCIFFNENVLISIKISLKFVPKRQINNIPALVQIMAWRRSGDKPLSEAMMENLLTHICVTRPQCSAMLNLFQEILNLYLHSLSFLNMEIVQVVEVLPYGR